MGRRRRIGLYCRSNVIGGAEAALLNLAAGHVGDDDLVIVSPSPEVIESAAQIAPNVERHFIADGDGIRTMLALRRGFARLSLDLLQITLPNPFAARDAQLAAFSLRLPVITVQQLVLAPRRRRGAWIVRLFAVPIRATIAVGDRSGRDVATFFGIPERKIHIIHNGVPAEAPAPVELECRPVIGCVARYEEQKALHRLIEAMTELPDARLMLIGDGSLRDDLHARATALGVHDRVQIAGWTKAARTFIASFDVFVLPSVDEAFPLTIVEAMLARTPVVATDVGSVSEAVIDGETGLLVQSGDAAGLVEAIRRVLYEPGLANRLVSSAHDFARCEFTADTMAANYAEIWQRILATPKH